MFEDFKAKVQHHYETRLFQKAMLGKPLLEIEAELAKQRQLANLKQGEKAPLSSFELNGDKGQARDIVAEKVGLSPTTFHRAKPQAKTVYVQGKPYQLTAEDGKARLKVIRK